MLLVDGNNFLWRAHHVSQDLSSNGVLTGALHVGLSMLIGMADLFPPQRVVFLWDAHPSWRKKIYPDYKGNRSEGSNEEREAVHHQMELFRYVIRHVGIWQIQREGLEADDLAGILVTGNRAMAKFLNERLTLISSDKDWFQLLDVEETVDQIRGWKGKELDRYTATRVLEKYEVPVDRWAEYLALVGDEGDNIPNVYRGMGPVTAKKIINGEKKMDPKGEKQYQTNLLLTRILRDAKDWSLVGGIDTGTRTRNGLMLVEQVLDKYELHSVWQNRRRLWEIGGWTSGAGGSPLRKEPTV